MSARSRIRRALRAEHDDAKARQLRKLYRKATAGAKVRAPKT